ncbi:hypothetical protein HDU76_009684, partial [Blyttiomyces sp. JEL0837]
QKTEPNKPDVVFSKAGIHGFLTKSTTIQNFFLNGLRLPVEAFEPLCTNENIIEIQLKEISLTDNDIIQLAGYIEKAKSLQRLYMNNLIVDRPEAPAEPEKEGESTEEAAPAATLAPEPDLKRKTTKIPQDDIGAMNLVKAFEKNHNMTKLDIDYSSFQRMVWWQRLTALNKKRNGETYEEETHDFFDEEGDLNLDTMEKAVDPAQEVANKEGEVVNTWESTITNVVPGDDSDDTILKFAEETKPGEDAPAVVKPKSFDSPVVILSTLKSNILRTAASLAEQNVEYTKAKEVEEAVDYIEQAERGITAKHYKFIMDWGSQDRLSERGVYFLSAISDNDRVPDAQEAIIREMVLRIKLSKAPEAEGGEKVEHAATDYIPETYMSETTISARVAKYPTLKHVESVKNIYEDGCLYVLFLSDKILDGIDHDIDSLWNALNFWDQLIYLANKHL